MAEQWHFLDNQFDNVTKGSRKQMQVISNDHWARLSAQAGDVDIDGLIARTQPVHDGFINQYTGWFSSKAFHEGSTLGMTDLLEDLRGKKIRLWDAAIMPVFDVGTEEYITLLPNRRSPFQTGGIDERLSEVLGLSQRLSEYPALAALQTTVAGFYTTLKNKRDLQQQREGLVQSNSIAVEVAREAIALMMYRNLGVLIDKYGATPNVIATFWEQKNLKRGAVAEVEPAPPITGTIPGNGTVAALDGGFDENSTFVLRATGANLVFCTNDAEANPCAQGVAVQDGEEVTAEASELGSPVGQYLNVTNITPQEGEYEIIVM